MMTVEFSSETLNKKLWTSPETNLSINFKHLIGPKGRDTGRLPLYPIILWLLVSLRQKYRLHNHLNLKFLGQCF